MNKSKFLIDIHCPLVVDASFVINLNATNEAIDILNAIPHRVEITKFAAGELNRGRVCGHHDAEKLARLIAEGLVTEVSMGEVGDGLFESLISGEDTLDDGEAATLAYALATSSIAVVDERKGRRICGDRFPSLELVSSVELLLSPGVSNRLGNDRHIRAIMGSLLDAKMQVPREQVASLVAAIGQLNASKCASLPRSVRMVI